VFRIYANAALFLLPVTVQGRCALLGRRRGCRWRAPLGSELRRGSPAGGFQPV